MSDYLDEVMASVPALRRYARALTHDVERADDLVQDCLERAVRRQSLWRPTGPLKAWLFKVLVNIYRNDLRRERRRPTAEPLETMTVEPHVPESQTGQLALADMARAMQQLAPEQREALLLVVLEGLSYAEAAEVLDIPIGTLMSRIGRARAALRASSEGTVRRLRSVK